MRQPGFAVVDVETTGFSPEDERIIEVGVVVLDADGVEMDAFSTLCNPGRDPGPTHIHGITAAMLDGAPSFSAIHPYLAAQLSGRVVVGHNVDRFDLAFLRAECRRSGGATLVPGPVPTVDTLSVAQGQLELPGRATLVHCCTHFDLSWDEHHHALGDARVTAALFNAMRLALGDSTLGVAGLLEEASATAWPGRSAVPPTTRLRAASLAG